MELSNSLTEVTLHDIKWAVDNGYRNDVKWVVMNVVSILSNKKRIHRNKKEFKEITGKSLYCPTSSPACDWCGWLGDVIILTSVICKKHPISIERQLHQLTRDESKELNIRLRHFSYCKRNPIYGESSQLKKDELGNYYMWDYSHFGMLMQIPEQLMKEYLLLWENRDLLCHK